MVIYQHFRGTCCLHLQVQSESGVIYNDMVVQVGVMFNHIQLSQMMDPEMVIVLFDPGFNGTVSISHINCCTLGMM
jgi:hypothetical protein